jgi:hypothetical protein
MSWIWNGKRSKLEMFLAYLIFCLYMTCLTIIHQSGSDFVSRWISLHCSPTPRSTTGFALHCDSIFRKPPLKSSQNNLSNGGSVPSKHYTNRNTYTVYSPLGETFCISYREKVEYLLNFSSFSQRLCFNALVL